MSVQSGSRFAILGLLSWQPMSGYDIKKYVEIGLSYFWSESYGAIYPTLARLVEEGLADRQTDASRGRRRRHLYHITDAGRAAFLDWLEQPTAPPKLRSEFKLKFFLAWDRPIADRQRLVTEHREQQQQHLQVLKESEPIIKRAIEEGDIHPELDGLLSENGTVTQLKTFLMTLRNGIRLTEARLAWCDEAERLLAEENRGLTGEWTTA